MAPSNDSSIVNRFPSIDLSIRPSLHQILEQPEQFFHISQQSAKMSVDHNRRTRLSNELKRRADIERYRESVVKPASLRQELVDVEQVTLTMEVTYSDYEEMFTKRTLSNTEESCANIMLDTNTIIQFPDRDEPNPDFIHQVTITGHLTGVEEARIRLRKFCPLVLMFAVSERLREGVPYKKLNCWIKEKIEDGSLNFPTLVIQALPQPVSTSFKISFSTHMEVPAAQRSQLVGTPDGAQLGLLPMQLCFHAGNEDLRAQIKEDHFISLRTSEYNVGALYAVMRRILKRGDKIPMVTPTDYAEMLPLVPDLIKHACEVNVKCRLEPRILDLPSLSHVVPPTPTSLSSNLLSANFIDQSGVSQNVIEPSEGAILPRRKPSPITYNRHNCLDTSLDANSSAQSNKTDNGSSSRVAGANRSRNTSPQNIYPSKFSLRYNDKENNARGAFSNFGRMKNYNVEHRNNSFRSFRFGAANTSHSKHHLALRNREADVDKAVESRLHRNNSSPQIESCSRAGGDEIYQRRRNNHLQNGSERVHHGIYERRTGAEWRSSQSKPTESPVIFTHTAKTVLNQRPRNEKIELQRRDKENQTAEDQETNVRRQSNKRMDVMDLIKLASAEDNDRRLSSVEENNSVLDSGDATGSNSVIDCNNSDTADITPLRCRLQDKN
ncbi:hypothetical protein OSTOST_07507 [Ostertagia ostertagi]